MVYYIHSADGDDDRAHMIDHTYTLWSTELCIYIYIYIAKSAVTTTSAAIFWPHTIISHRKSPPAIYKISIIYFPLWLNGLWARWSVHWYFGLKKVWFWAVSLERRTLFSVFFLLGCVCEWEWCSLKLVDGCDDDGNDGETMIAHWVPEKKNRTIKKPVKNCEFASTRRLSLVQVWTGADRANTLT